MEIRADEISRIIREQVQGYDASLSVQETGTVLTVGDGIARIDGLANAMAGELLAVPQRRSRHGPQPRGRQRRRGAARQRDNLIKEGDQAKRTGTIMSVPVGDALVGRVVNTLGQPIDGKGPIESVTKSAVIELKAPGIIKRKSVHEPMQTGLKAIDAMIPIGRGQRELIIGDRQTGKTAIGDRYDHQPKGAEHDLRLRGDRSEAVDGRDPSSRSSKKAGAMEYTIVVAATLLRLRRPCSFLAPYTGVTMGEFFRDNGKATPAGLR